jgi:hypothetical protein
MWIEAASRPASAVQRHAAPLAGVGLVVAASVLAMVWWTPHFETNDDVWFMLNTSGQTLPAPNPYVYWLNAALTGGLVALYRLAAGVPWYGLLHATGVLAALSAVAAAALAHGASARRVGLLGAGVLLLGFPFVIQWQFTRLAMLATTGGLFLAITTLTEARAASGHARLARLGGAVALLLLGYQVRHWGFWLVLAVFAPLLVLLAWTGPRRRAVSVGLALGAAGILVGAAWAVDASVYGTPEWARFHELNRLKSAFLDYDRVPLDARTRAAIGATGWSENDYQMLMHWFYVDGAVYSPAKLAAVVAMTARDGPPPHERLAEGFRAVLPHLARAPFAWVAGALLLGGALLVVRGRTAVVGVSITVLAAAVMMALLLAFAKLPERVEEPLLAALAWLPLAVGSERTVGPGRAPRITSVTGLAAVAVAVGLGLAHPAAPLRVAAEESRQAERDNRDLRVALGRLAAGGPRTVVVVGGSFPYPHILPLESKEYLSGLRIVGLGASNQSPMQRRVLAAHGIVDLHRALFERSDLAIALRPAHGTDRILERYIAEHYGVQVRVAVWFDEPPILLARVTPLGGASRAGNALH